MVKILFIHNKLVCGGAEQALFDLLSLMDKKKFDITVFEQFEGGIWTDKFRNSGIRVVSPWSCQRYTHNPIVKMRNFWKRIHISRALNRGGKRLLEICLEEDYDIVVSYHVITQHEIGFFRNAKTVKYIHSDMSSFPVFHKNIMDTIETIKRFDRIICVSEKVKQAFISETHIMENVRVCLNPINSMDICQKANEIDIVDYEMPIICAVGRLAPEKGFDRLIRIHQQLCNEGLKHKLLIVGDGEEKMHLLDVIRENLVDGSVEMVGYKSNPYPYIYNSRFLVCSSYTEGLPVVAMEALSLGIPVVSTIASVKELFGSENCGIITEPDDLSLKNGIRQMLVDDVLYRSVKDGARKRREFFSGEEMARKVEKELLSLLD